MIKALLDMNIEIGDEITIIDNDMRELRAEENYTINYEVLFINNRVVKRGYNENEKIYSVNYLLQ